MPFILFLILILILVNGMTVIKYMYKMALFAAFVAMISFTSYVFLVATSDNSMKVMAGEEKVLEFQAQDKSHLDKEIYKLRVELKSVKSLSEKKTLMKHLQRLEKLQKQQQSETEALESLNEDKLKLKELRKLQASLEEGKKKFKKEAKRLLELQKQIKRSEKLIEKLNSVDNLKKGIKHD